MLDIFNSLSNDLDWVLIAAPTIVALGALLVVYRAYRRLRDQNTQLGFALDNMTQGLCMFDSATRLIICNERYRDMYGLTRELACPGRTLRELLEYRRQTGTFFQDIDE